MPLDQILRAPRNPKDHDLGQINKSIHRFGFVNPILINESTGRLVAGHGRVDDLQQLKASGKRPPQRIIEKDGKWLVPVIRGVSFENDDEAEAYLVADNQLTILGGWNDAELANILSDLSAKGEEMLDGIGFDTDDLDDLLKRLNREIEQEEKEQDEAEVVQPAEVLLAKYDPRPGDIWQVGNHFIVNGDCRDIPTVMELMECAGVSSFNGVFTSPPYAEQRAKKAEWYGGIPEEEYVDWWGLVQANIAQFLSDQGSFFLNIKPNVVDGARVLYVFDLVSAMVREWDWLLIDEFCWERLGAPGRWHNRFKNGFEPVYQFSKTVNCEFYPDQVADKSRSGMAIHGGNNSTGNYYNTNNKTVEWDEVLPSNRIPSFGNAIGSMHPAAFPIGLPIFFMKAFSESDSVWYDPFAGSGTVGVAAERVGRKSLLVELSPRYVAVSLERLSIATGLAPEKVSEYQNANDQNK